MILFNTFKMNEKVWRQGKIYPIQNTIAMQCPAKNNLGYLG